MVPAIDFRDPVVIVRDYYLLIALYFPTIYTAGRNAFTHTSRRDIDDFAQPIFWDCNTDSAQQTCAVRYILCHWLGDVAKQTVDHEQEQTCDDKATGTCQDQDERQG